jgi:hypothetical protein
MCLAEGRWTDATHCLRECIEICERPGNVKHLAKMHRMLAELDLLQGDESSVCPRLETVLARPDLSAADVIGLLSLVGQVRE